MLIYKFDRIFKARGISRPSKFLRSAGFSDNFATRVSGNRVKRLNLKELEKLCLHLNCTPNEFMEWIPDENRDYEKDHALYTLRRTVDETDIMQMVWDLHLDKIPRLKEMIQKEFRKKEES